jgi:hypothetical protein
LLHRLTHCSIDFPTIFVEAGLEIPYSVEVFDQAMQNNFKQSVAVALDVRPYRVKIENINVATPNARRLLAYGCEVSFSVRVPGGNEAKAQAILAALTLERVNMQLEQKGLSASLNFVVAPRIDRKPCEADKYRVNADCDSCPSNSSSPAGSVGIQACLCNAVSATGERSREGGRGAGPSSPSSLNLSFALSFSLKSPLQLLLLTSPSLPPPVSSSSFPPFPPLILPLALSAPPCLSFPFLLHSFPQLKAEREDTLLRMEAPTKMSASCELLGVTSYSPNASRRCCLNKRET